MLNAHFHCKVMGRVVLVCYSRTTVHLNIILGCILQSNIFIYFLLLDGCLHINAALKTAVDVTRIFKKLVGKEIIISLLGMYVLGICLLEYKNYKLTKT